MMDDPLRIIAEGEGHVFLYREAISAGFKDHQIAQRRRTGEWHRVRHGAYCFGDVWRRLKPEERHLVHAHAVRRTTPGHFAFSHVTALVAHGIAVWNVDLATVHLTRLDGCVARRHGDALHHAGQCGDDEVVRIGGLLVTHPQRAVLETATIVGVEEALVSFDSALWKGHGTLEELRDRFCRRRSNSGRFRRLKSERFSGV